MKIARTFGIVGALDLVPDLAVRVAEARKGAQASASASAMAGPSHELRLVAEGSRLAVSVPSNSTLAWVPSQKGLVLEWPQRHSA